MARTKKSKPGVNSRAGMASNSTVESGVHAQAEIWDDSALLRSWDDAVKEYEVSDGFWKSLEFEIDYPTALYLLYYCYTL